MFNIVPDRHVKDDDRVTVGRARQFSAGRGGHAGRSLVRDSQYERGPLSSHLKNLQGYAFNVLFTANFISYPPFTFFKLMSQVLEPDRTCFHALSLPSLLPDYSPITARLTRHCY